jgi:hypothetical protein
MPYANKTLYIPRVYGQTGESGLVREADGSGKKEKFFRGLRETGPGTVDPPGRVRRAVLRAVTGGGDEKGRG